MKICIVEDELYPFFDLREEASCAPTFVITRKKVNRWIQVMEEFEKVQNEMRYYHDNEGDLK